MVNSHIQSFFGRNIGMIIKSPSRTKPYIFVQFIKKKANGIWEKPSCNEGKLVKFSLEEIIMILQVLNHNMKIWTNFHSYQKKKTHISFNWEENSTEILWINVDGYSKMLNFAQVEILRLLLVHLLNEKIIHATSAIKSKMDTEITQDIDYENFIVSDLYEQFYVKKMEEKLQKNISLIEGLIKEESNKAFLIKFNSGQDIWIPKSTIHSHYYPRKNILQTFSIESWILRKNNLLNK